MRRTCLACGLETSDERAVRMKVVEYDDPISVDVVARINERHGYRGQPELVYARVPGQYGAEWRCVDEVACAERARPMAVVPPPAAHDTSQVAATDWFDE